MVRLQCRGGKETHAEPTLPFCSYPHTCPLSFHAWVFLTLISISFLNTCSHFPPSHLHAFPFLTFIPFSFSNLHSITSFPLAPISLPKRVSIFFFHTYLSLIIILVPYPYPSLTLTRDTGHYNTFSTHTHKQKTALQQDISHTVEKRLPRKTKETATLEKKYAATHIHTHLYV